MRKYHKDFSNLALTGMCVAMIALYVLEWEYVGIILASAIVIFSLVKPVLINWEMYYKDMKYYSKVQSAAARKDYAVMMALANENSVRQSYRIPYVNFTHLNPLISRSILIDAFRAPLSMWLIKLAALAVALCSSVLPLAHIYKMCFFILAWSYLILFIVKHSVEGALSLRAKCKMGLFIPYKLQSVAMYYSILPSFEILFSLFLLILLTDVISWAEAWYWFIYDCIIYAWHFTALKCMKQRKWIDWIAGLTISIISILFIL